MTLAVGDALLACGLQITGVASVGSSFGISYSEKPVTNLRGVDVGQWCARHGILHYPFAGYDALAADLAALHSSRRPQLCLVAGWYHMVPRSFRALFPRGCLAFHASLLPQLRGGAPLNWAILLGLNVTGVTLFELSDGVDDGPIYAQTRLAIGSRTQVGELVAASREACASLVANHVPAILSGRLAPRPQEGTPSYSLQRTPEDGRIDWRRSAAEIDRLVRAVGRPYAGASTMLEGGGLLVWEAALAPSSMPQVYGACGQLVRLPELDGIAVVTGAGLLVLREVTDAAGMDAMGLLRRSAQKRLGG